MTDRTSLHLYKQPPYQIKQKQTPSSVTYRNHKNKNESTLIALSNRFKNSNTNSVSIFSVDTKKVLGGIAKSESCVRFAGLEEKGGGECAGEGQRSREPQLCLVMRLIASIIFISFTTLKVYGTCTLHLYLIDL